MEKSTSEPSSILNTWFRDDNRNLQVKMTAIFATMGWIVCCFAYVGSPEWTVDVYYLCGLLPFLFDIGFTFIYSDMFHLELCWENYLIFLGLLLYNSFLVLPLFWLNTSLFVIVTNYTGSLVINVNCSLTMLRVFCRSHQYLDFFTISRLPVFEIKSGPSNRNVNENDLTYAITNIKSNMALIRRTIDYLTYRLFFTAPFYFVNLIIALQTDYYAGYIKFLANFIPISTPFLFLCLIIMTHNAKILAWEDYNLIDSGCSIKIFGVRLRHAWVISLVSFLVVVFVNVFLK